MVAEDLGRCFRTKSSVRPDIVKKKPDLMTAIKVEGTGENAPW